jgi:hypothetical protein
MPKWQVIVVLVVLGFLAWACGATGTANLIHGFLDWVRTFGEAL